MRRAFSSPFAAAVFTSLLIAGCSAPTSSADAGAGGGSGGGSAGGGAGGGGAMACTPGATAPCYSGAQGTEGVGACTAGTKTCHPDGSGFGSCSGEVVPRAETCADLADEDCDGLVNEEGSDCTCVPGATQPCYSGAPATLGMGPCHGGMQTCRADGLGFGACMAEVIPSPRPAIPP